MTCKSNANILRLIIAQVGSLTTYLQTRSEAELAEITSDLDSFLDDADKLRDIIADVITYKATDKLKAMDYQS